MAHRSTHPFCFNLHNAFGICFMASVFIDITVMPVWCAVFGHTPWVPVTLAQNGTFYLAWSAVLGVSTWRKFQPVDDDQKVPDHQ
jgi:threonine/homoserine/homoserine lactone efflux protein